MIGEIAGGLGSICSFPDTALGFEDDRLWRLAVSYSNDLFGRGECEGTSLPLR